VPTASSGQAALLLSCAGNGSALFPVVQELEFMVRMPMPVAVIVALFSVVRVHVFSSVLNSGGDSRIATPNGSGSGSSVNSGGT
jgi:hypothetical protein